MTPATNAEAASPQRLFFALWPDAASAAALGRAARAAARVCGGKPTRPETIHLTLAFIGNVPAERVTVLRQLAPRVDAGPFDLELDRIGFWRHNRILWAGAGGVPPALTLLVGQLNGLLREAGFRLEDRPFAAHVTLLRRADCRGGAERGIDFAPLRWPVTEFVLMESVLRPEGADYRPLARYGLQGP
jgi:2'-5' RNA ligase